LQTTPQGKATAHAQEGTALKVSVVIEPVVSIEQVQLLPMFPYWWMCCRCSGSSESDQRNSSREKRRHYNKKASGCKSWFA